MENHKILLELLDNPKFREYTLNGRHTEFWLSWLKANPDEQKIFELGRLILLELKGEEWNEGKKAQIFNKLKSSIADQDYLVKKRNLRKKTKYFQAAMFVILFISSIYLTYEYISGTVKHSPNTVTESHDLIKRNTSFGQKSRINLPDGSAVTLNSGSEIQYDNEFAISHRKIELVGEAFFEIAKNQDLPFSVISHNLVTTALGTSFNVRSYNPQNTTVQLATGKVKVHIDEHPKENIELLPGEQINIIDHDRLLKSKFNTEKAFKWRDGILIFTSASWSEVINELERWYGVTITVEGKIPENKKVTAEFKRDFLSNVLSSLSFSFNFHYRIERDQVIIKFK